MDKCFCVTIKPVGDVNGVVISVDHHKHSKAVVASFYPGILQAGRIHQTVMTAGKYVNTEPMTRLNQKKVEAHRETAKQQIAAKNGVYYDHLLAFMKEKNYELAD